MKKIKKTSLIITSILLLVLLTSTLIACANKKIEKTVFDLSKYQIDYQNSLDSKLKDNAARGFYVNVDFNYKSSKTKEDSSSITTKEQIENMQKELYPLQFKTVQLNVDLSYFLDKLIDYKFKEKEMDSNSAIYKNSLEFEDKFFYLKSTINAIKSLDKKVILNFYYKDVTNSVDINNILSHIDSIWDKINSLSKSYQTQILAIYYVDLNISDDSKNTSVLNYSYILSNDTYRMLVQNDKYDKIQSGYRLNRTGVLSNNVNADKFNSLVQGQFNIATLKADIQNEKQANELIIALKNNAISMVDLQNSKSTLEKTQKFNINAKTLNDNSIITTKAWYLSNDGKQTEIRVVYDYITQYLGYHILIANLKTEAKVDTTTVSFDLVNIGTSSAFFIDKITLCTIDQKDGKIKNEYEFFSAPMDTLTSNNSIHVTKTFTSKVPDGAKLSIKIYLKDSLVLTNNNYETVQKSIVIYKN